MLSLGVDRLALPGSVVRNEARKPRSLDRRLHVCVRRRVGHMSTIGVAMTMPDAVALHHTAFVVRDLEGAAQGLSDALRIGPWNLWTIEPAECYVHGEPSRFSFRIALATVGSGAFELVSPHGGHSVIDEHLSRNGEGFHHTCLVYPTMEAVRAAKAELRQQGREIIQEAWAGDIFDFTYVRFPEIGSIVELLYLDASKLPAPERVIGLPSPSTPAV